MVTADEASKIIKDLAKGLKLKYMAGPLIVGLSGGADSTLALLASLKLQELDPVFKVAAVHCIHGLDADDPVWLKHNKELCKKLGVPLSTPRLNIVYGPGISKEEASRKERYEKLLKKLPKNGYLVLGHQADDVAEGVLLALKRGSGPLGLSGMQELTVDKRGKILRPLLSLHKAQIEEILKALDIPYVYDVSNSYLYFERNFIRHKVMPLIEKRFPAFASTAVRSARLCAIEHDLCERYVSKVQDRYIDEKALIFNPMDLHLDDKPLFLCLIRRFLSLVLERPPELALCEQAIKMIYLNPDQEAQLKVGDHALRCYEGRLYLLSKLEYPKERTAQIYMQKPLLLGDFVYVLCRCSAKSLAHLKSPFTLHFNVPRSFKLQGYQDTVRRSLKKLYQNSHVPYWMRPAVPVVTYGGIALAAGELSLKPSPLIYDKGAYRTLEEGGPAWRAAQEWMEDDELPGRSSLSAGDDKAKRACRHVTLCVQSKYDILRGGIADEIKDQEKEILKLIKAKTSSNGDL